jgi:hypothetical protein
MNLLKNHRRRVGRKWLFSGFLVMIFIFTGYHSYSQIDSRNQIRPDREKNFVDPDKKTRKRIRSKKNPRFTGKKAYSNRKQLKRSKKSRARYSKVDRSPKGDITGRKIKPKKTKRTTYARSQPDPYKNRRIRTERSRAGPDAPEVRSATKKGERARTGDISGQKRVRQKSVRSARTRSYPQPNPYVGRKIRTEKSRAKSNKREIRSVRSVSRPSEFRQPKRQVAPISATVAPKVKTKRNVYRSHERRGGEKSTDRDIAGRKIRTKNKRSAVHITGGIEFANPNPYTGSKRYKEGERFKRSRARPASARSITRPPETSSYRQNDIYASRRNSRSRTFTGVIKAKRVRSTSQPSKKGEKPIYGKKYRAKSIRSISGSVQLSARRSPVPPGSISGRRKQYRQRNIYRGKDRHFGENATSKDIAGRKLRTRNYRSYNPSWSSIGFMPYYGGRPSKESAKTPSRRIKSKQRAGWNNSGQPIMGRGRNANSEAMSGFKGKMPMKAIPSYGKGNEGVYSGRIPSKTLRKYSAGKEGIYSGRTKARKPLFGGGSITKGWNNGGQPLMGKGRNANNVAISGYRGKMPLSAMPSYGKGKEGVYSGRIPSKTLRKYSAGREGTYAGRMKARKPLIGGGSVSKHWNNQGQPLMGKGQNANSEAISGYRGKTPLSAMPSYGKGKEGVYSGRIPSKTLRKYSAGREGTYAGRMKARKPLLGGGSITKHWNNQGQPLVGKGSNANNEAISGYRGKMPMSAMPSYGKGGEGVYAGKMKARKPLKGGGSITRHWNNKGQPLLGPGRNANNEAISGFQGKMPINAMPSYGKGREGVYAGKMKAKKPLKGGGGSITRHWNNKEQPLIGKGRNATSEAISNYQGKMPLSAIPGFSGGKEEVYQGNVKVSDKKKGYHTERFIGGDAKVKRKYIGQSPGTTYGSRKKFLFVYNGVEGGYMPPKQNLEKSKSTISPKVPPKRIGQSPGTERGRTRSFTFLRLGNPTQGGLHRELANTSKNNNLPDDIKGTNKLRTSASPGTERGRTKSLSFVNLGNPTRGGFYKDKSNRQRNRRLPSELSGKQRLRIKGTEGLDNGRSVTFTFWAIGNPTHGGLVRSPSQAKGRLHPSSTYTAGNKPRNSIEDKDQPIKLKIWWAKLFKKNANQPDSVKDKPRRPRYDKGERSIWETAERPDWYNN